MDKVDTFISKKSKWTTELKLLRSWLLETELEENIKWGTPVYSLEGKNVIGLGAFKSYVGIWFFQGVFLEDKQGLLVNAQEGKTKALRQMRFHNKEDINEKAVKNYIQEAIDNQKAGKEVRVERKKYVEIPKELHAAFRSNNELKDKFKSLSPGKQREYANYIIEAKRQNTKASRLEKITPMILQGVGLNDKYKNC